MDEKELSKALAYKAKGLHKRVLSTLQKVKVHTEKSLLLVAETCDQLGEHQQAIIAAKKVINLISREKDKAELFLFIGLCYKKQDKLLAAISYIEKSIEIDDSVLNGDAVYNLAFLYLSTLNVKRFDELSDKLIKWDKFYAGTYLMRIQSAVYHQNKSLIDNRLADIEPYAHLLDSPQMAKVSTFYIDFLKFESLNRLITKYEKLNPGVTLGLEAKLAFEQKDYEKVLELLNEDFLNDAKSAALTYLAADAHQKLKDYKQSFLLFNKASKLKQIEAKASQIVVSTTKPFEKLCEIKRCPNVFDVKQIFVKVSFITGFPRSGTTLIDNIIDTQDDILVFSETGVFIEVIRAFKETLGKRYPDDIYKLSCDDIGYLRGVYFSTIENIGFDVNDYNMVVEKSPHYIKHLPFIDLIFPEAKLIYMQRNPLDSCISSFQKDFILTEENNTTSLKN